MVVECGSCRQKNRIPDIPESNAKYRCGKCGKVIEVVWAASSSSNSLEEADAGGDQLMSRSVGLGRVSRVPAIISMAFLVLAAVANWPYGFYTVLRFVVCGSAIYLGFTAASLNSRVWPWVMGVTAVLFNPLVPVHFPRSTWRVLDFVAAVVFAISLATLRGKSPRTK